MVTPIKHQETLGNMGNTFYVSRKLGKPSKLKKTWGIGRLPEREWPRVFRLERKFERKKIKKPEAYQFLRHGNGISFPLGDSNYFISRRPADPSNRKPAESRYHVKAPAMTFLGCVKNCIRYSWGKEVANAPFLTNNDV